MSGDLVLGASRRNMRLVERYEKEAQVLLQAGEVMGYRSYPPWPWPTTEQQRRENDDWWINVMGDTERDLQAYQASLARRYRQACRRGKVRRARSLKERYIRVNSMLTIAHGLETCWR